MVLLPPVVGFAVHGKDHNLIVFIVLFDMLLCHFPATDSFSFREYLQEMFHRQEKNSNSIFFINNYGEVRGAVEGIARFFDFIKIVIWDANISTLFAFVSASSLD